MDKKYLALIDDEMQEFVRLTEGFYPSGAIHAPIEEQRASYVRLCKAFDSAYPRGISANDRHIVTPEYHVAVRDYQHADRLGRAHIVFFHGGGFVVGGLESHDSICAEFCAGTRCELTAVDYRLAPEHPHPAAFLDCLNVLDKIADETALPIILVGDSAGGTLAAALAHAVRDRSFALAGQVLIYPALGGELTKGSYVEHANAPLLTREDVEFYMRVRAVDAGISVDPTANPLADSDFSELPPTIIFAAECDPLADDGQEYCDAIKREGGKAACFNETGLVHGYLRARNTAVRARKSVDRIISALNMLADGDWEI